MARVVFNGLIDEVRIWDTIRTEAEINADMHREISGAEPNLLGYWRFNEGSGETAFDQSPHGYHGSLKNGVRWTRFRTPLFPAWLAVTPPSGTVTAESSMDIDVTIDATDLSDECIITDLIIVSNDQDEPRVWVPISLKVDLGRKGDVDGDCYINILDAILAVNFILGAMEPTPEQEARTDCNGPPGNCDGDGQVNILDVIKIVNLILRLDECP